MTFDSNNVPQDIDDNDVWWMLKNGFNANELAYTARCSLDVAKAWMLRVAHPRVDEVPA